MNFFISFLGKLRASSQANYTVKEEIKKVIEKRLPDFLKQCNDLIREVQLQLESIGKKKLLIIIEDLDKMYLNSSRELFSNYHHLFYIPQNKYHIYLPSFSRF